MNEFAILDGGKDILRGISKSQLKNNEYKENKN